MFRGLWLTVVGMLLLAHANARADAAAPAPALELALQGPEWLERCLTQSALDAGVRARASSPLPSPLQVRVMTVGEEQDSAQWIDIEVSAERGELGSRQLEVHAADCAALPNAVAIVVVLLAQSSEPAQPPPASRPAGTAPEPTPVARARAPLAEIDSEPYWRVAVGAGVGLAIELLPSTAGSAHVRGELNLADHWIAVLQLEVPLPQTLAVEEGEVSFAAYALSADVCAGARDRGQSPLLLRACAGPAAALVHAQGDGFLLDNRNQNEVMLAFAARAELAAAVAPFSRIVLQAGGGVAALRPRFLLSRT